jgi:hypothetical protein
VDFRRAALLVALAVLLSVAAASSSGVSVAGAHNPSDLYPVRWPAYTDDPFQIDIDFAKNFPARRFRNRIRSATKEWNRLRPGPFFKANFGSTKAATQNVCSDVANRHTQVQYEHVSGNAIAVTKRCIRNEVGAPRTLKSVLISFDSSEKKAWNRSRGSARDANGDGKVDGRADVQAVATHELGHALGSDDYVVANVANDKYCLNDLRRETMCKIYFRGHERERTLGAHDKETFNEAYPSPLWWGDAERGYRHEWQGASNDQCKINDRFWRRGAAEVQTGPAQGRSFYDFRVIQGQSHTVNGSTDSGQRCELGQALSPQESRGYAGFAQFHSGDDDWISWQVYLPSTGANGVYPFNLNPGATSCYSGGSDFQAIAQWKQVDHGIYTGTPALAMTVENGRFCLDSSSDNKVDNNTSPARDVGPANRGRWIKFSLHVKFSTSDSTGFIELWGDLDGNGMKQLWPVPGSTACPSQPCVEHIHTMKLDPVTNFATATPSHSRIGIYRSDSIQGGSDLFYDGYTVAASRAAAEANAFRK